MSVKKEFDRIYGTTWHCVVGKKWVCESASDSEYHPVLVLVRGEGATGFG
jgi:hypothetical protein